MCSLGVVVLVQVLFLSKSQTSRWKASRLDTIFQISYDLLVLALFLHSIPPLILLHCTFFSFLAMSGVFLSFTSRGKCGILRSKIYRIILFENLFKLRQLRLAVDMVTDFVSSIHNLKTVFWADFVSLIYNLKAVLWATCGSLPSLLFDFHWV